MIKFFDSLTNVIAQIGLGGDKAAHSRYSGECLTEAELIDAYRFAWLPARIVDVPADQATRNWRKWTGDPTTVDRIEEIERRINLQQAVNECLKDARLFGHAAILIRTNSNTMHAPLRDNERIVGLDIVEMPTNNTGILSRFRSATQSQNIIRINNQNVHTSRLCPMRGRYIPRMNGGDSVLNPVYRACLNADGVTANIAALVFEAKVDVFKIPNLMEIVGTQEGESQLMRRLSVANHGKSVTNSLLMDAEESYEQKHVNFGGLNDVLLTALQIAAGASGIPATKLLGTSVGGLNAKGDSEIRDFYDEVASEQANKIGPAIRAIDRLMLNEAQAADDVDYEWGSLWSQSETEKADNVQKLAVAIKTIADTAVFGDDEVRDAAAQVLGEYMPALEGESYYDIIGSEDD